MSLLNAADSVYLGNGLADRVYLGPDLVWLSLAVRQSAATNAADADVAGGSYPFYAEIGDRNNILWSHSAGTGAPIESDQMSLASCSKPFYAALMAETRSPLSATDIQALLMRSGYHSMLGNNCAQTETVQHCLLTVPPSGPPYDHFVAGDVDKFFYDSAHHQHHAVNVAGLGADVRGNLATLYRSTFGLTTDTFFSTPTLATGMVSTARDVRIFCRQILNAELAIAEIMFSDANEVNASLYFTDGSVLYSPVSSAEPWRYRPGWWRDPVNNLIAGIGKLGYVIGFTSDRSKYIIIARSDPSSGGLVSQQSINTERAVLNAFLTGEGATTGGGGGPASMGAMQPGAGWNPPADA